MSQTMTADGGRTETERFTDSINADDLVEGDRIAPELVPNSTDIDVGARVATHIAVRNDETDDRTFDVRLIAQSNRFQNDVVDALVYAPEADRFVRLTAHTSQSAWNQAERDWTVRDVGTDVTVADAWDIDIPDLGDDDEQEYVDEWVDVVFGELRFDNELGNEIESFDGKTLTLRDYDSRTANVRIELED